jgi:hypothetical protein
VAISLSIATPNFGYPDNKRAPLLVETLINSKIVIASEAKQSRITAKSKASGSPRRFTPRDDGINQRFLSVRPVFSATTPDKRAVSLS